MEPVIVEGRAASYLRTNSNNSRFLSGPFDQPRGYFGEVDACVEHTERWSMASSHHLTGRGYPGGRLELWTGLYGLGFRATSVPMREVRDVLNAIANQERCAVSIGWNPLKAVGAI